VVASLQRLAEKHKILADLGRRLQDHQDLADVYANWAVLAFCVGMLVWVLIQKTFYD